MGYIRGRTEVGVVTGSENSDHNSQWISQHTRIKVRYVQPVLDIFSGSHVSQESYDSGPAHLKMIIVYCNVKRLDSTVRWLGFL